MRVFKRMNVVKSTDSDYLADRYLEAGYEEVKADKKAEEKADKVTDKKSGK